MLKRIVALLTKKSAAHKMAPFPAELPATEKKQIVKKATIRKPAVKKVAAKTPAKKTVKKQK